MADLEYWVRYAQRDLRRWRRITRERVIVELRLYIPRRDIPDTMRKLDSGERIHTRLADYRVSPHTPGQ